MSSKCAVNAGSTVTIEMHQQPGDRSCASEAIGGAHYGPVQVYMAKVADASTAVGSAASWFKVFADTWAGTGSSGSDDAWGTKDLNACCGRMNVKIPSDIAPGDYLLRAEALALHSAGSTGGAQFYSRLPNKKGFDKTKTLTKPIPVTCFQLTVSGSGNASPPTVKLPGAYAANNPGILINIYQSMTAYAAPGPSVYAGGSTKKAGSPCEACEATCMASAKRSLPTAV